MAEDEGCAKEADEEAAYRRSLVAIGSRRPPCGCCRSPRTAPATRGDGSSTGTTPTPPYASGLKRIYYLSIRNEDTRFLQVSQI